MWRQALESFDVMFVQNEESKRLLAGLGFDNVIVAGDTRFDRVAEIAKAAKHIDVIERFKGDKRVFVAGSTWGPDEELLIRLINDNPDIKFIVAPHEMDESRMARLAAEIKGGTLRYTQCTPHTSYGPKQLLILDTVGLLSSVYSYATWSYIGGGFGVGIHNTLEAATFGLPVAFGPNYQKFKEARDLVTLGAARSINDYDELRAWFVPLRDNEEFLRKPAASPRTTPHGIRARRASSSERFSIKRSGPGPEKSEKNFSGENLPESLPEKVPKKNPQPDKFLLKTGKAGRARTGARTGARIKAGHTRKPDREQQRNNNETTANGIKERRRP